MVGNSSRLLSSSGIIFSVLILITGSTVVFALPSIHNWPAAQNSIVPLPQQPSSHQTQQQQHHNQQHDTSALSEIDPVDKCLFTCDFCYKQTKILLACANECITSAAIDGTMGHVWLETCPFFGQPIYFDYQPI